MVPDSTPLLSHFDPYNPAQKNTTKVVYLFELYKIESEFASFGHQSYDFWKTRLRRRKVVYRSMGDSSKHLPTTYMYQEAPLSVSIVITSKYFELRMKTYGRFDGDVEYLYPGSLMTT